MHTEEVVLEGHIIDSLIFSKVLDELLRAGGQFKILEVRIGQSVEDRSFARLQIGAETAGELAELVAHVSHHGAVVQTPQDVSLVATETDGTFPEDFYSTTNQKTLVRHQGQWRQVADQEMDCGIRFDPDTEQFACVPIADARAGDRFVVGYRGLKVVPLERGRQAGIFEFMSSTVSSEKPKNVIIRDVARRMRQVKASGRKLLLVGGPAIVHTGSSEHVVKLIERGYVNVLFAGNALAVHDIERCLFNTSLGVHMDQAIPVETGHEHHLRAINVIRRAGGIRNAVETGVLTSGIMHACIRHGVDCVLAGSVRDDGPLPEVITDAMVAQNEMRRRIRHLGFALMIATGLHSIATGNLLPADVPVVCVDINSAIVTKLADRGSFQTVGVVTDVEPFLLELLHEL